MSLNDAVPSVADVRSSTPSTLSDALAAGTDLVDAHTGPILGLERHAGDRDATVVVQWNAEVQRAPTPAGDYYDPSPVAGRGLTDRAARIRAVGEAVERYCLAAAGDGSTVQTTFDPEDDDFVDPRRFQKFTDEQQTAIWGEPMAPTEQCRRWVPARELVSDEAVWVPETVVRLPAEWRTAPQPRLPTTVGAAAGTSLAGAVARAICELVERDAFAISHRNELPLPRVDVENSSDPRLSMLSAAYELDGRELYVFETTMDLPLCSCLSVAVDRTDHPAVRVGLGADATRYGACLDALLESFRVRPWDGPTASFPTADEVTDVGSRSAFWASHDRIDRLWLSLDRDPTRRVSHDDTPVDPVALIDEFLATLSDRGWTCLLSDVTTPAIRDRGFCAVKLVVPPLQPLHATGTPYLHGDRLFTAPVRAGLLDSPRSETELNETPHPML